MKKTIVFIALFSVMLAVLSIAQTSIDADLSGTNEVPPTNSTATGEVTATLDGNELVVEGSFDGLLADLHEISGSSAHVHEASVGSNGPIIFNLNVSSSDNRSGTFSLAANLTDEQVDDLMGGGYYVNVHSALFPGGEIRAQLFLNAIPENQIELNQTANQTANESNQTEVSQTQVVSTNASQSVDLHIMKWYPKGPDYVFVCNASGFEPTNFTWYYGDGHKLLNIRNQNTYHVYNATGTYAVNCTATDGTISASDSLTITVTNLTRPLHPLFGAAAVNQTLQVNQTTNASNQTCPTSVTAAGNASDNEINLKMEMRRLWEDHILWTRLYIISAVNNMSDADANLARLMKNQEDLGNSIRPFYGDNASQQLTLLLKEHIRIAGDIVAAAKSGNSSRVSELQAEWSSNADDLAGFLSAANPNIDMTSMKNMLQQHLDLTTQEAVAVINGNSGASISAYDSIKQQILSMSDELSEAIIAQFPDRF